MALLISGFEGFGDADFDVYREACWSNNLHNLDRMRTKARVKVLAERLLAAVGDAELVVEASSEIPSVWNGRQVRDQWAYLLRSDAARRRLQPVVARSVDLATRVKDPAEHHRHLLLAVRIDHAGVEVGLRIHQHATVDLANLLGRAERAGAELSALLAELPADVTLGGDQPVTAPGLVAAARAAQRGEADWVLVSRTWPRADAIAAAEALAAAVVATAESLLPLYRFAAWTPDNDHVGVQEKLESFAEAEEHRKEEAEAAKDAAAEEREARRQEARARTESRLAELKAWKQNLRVRRDDEPRPEPRAEQRPEPRPAEQRPVEPRPAEPPRAEEPRAPRPEGGPRGPRPEGGQRGPRPEGGQRGPRPEGAPRGPRPEGAPRGPRPEGAPRGPRPEGGPRGPRPEGAPRGPRPEGGQRGPRPEGAPPRGPRPSGRTPDARPPRSEAPRSSGRAPDVARPDEGKARKTLAVGESCRLDRGLLAGKVGVVRAVDAKKGYYQVRVGVLDVNIAFADVTPT